MMNEQEGRIEKDHENKFTIETENKQKKLFNFYL